MITRYNKCYVPANRDDFFNDVVSRRYYGNGYASTPAVNILEENDEYKIEIAAAGLRKEDFRLRIENDILTVSSEPGKEKKEEKDRYTRREFNFTSFTRSFKLDEVIDQDSVSAEYAEGILTVRLPKREEALKQGPKSIEIK